MKTPRLIKWANDGYPPINMNNELGAVIELIKAYKELESKQLHKPDVSGSLPLQEFMDEVEYMQGLYRNQKYTKAEEVRDKLAEKLDDWIFYKYATEGQSILDTHVGSGSSRIAAHKAGLNYTGFEIDTEYYEKQEKRFNDFVSQLRMF